MKTAIIEGNLSGNPSSQTAWYFLADSALTNAGKPFFIPEFAESFEVCLAPLVRISRLGKSIAPKFAPRYYSEIAPAVHFRAPELRARLLKEGLPQDMAYSFDRSLIYGSFKEAETIERDGIKMLKNGVVVAERLPGSTLEAAAHALEAVSAFNTMKTGDLIVPGLSEGVRIEQDDRIELLSGNERLLLVAIR